MNFEGFGHRIRFVDDHVVPAGHQMTFKDSLHTVSTGVIVPLILPKWGMIFTARSRKIRLAFHELEVGLSALILGSVISHSISNIWQRWFTHGKTQKRMSSAMIYSAAFLKLIATKPYLVATLSFLLQSYWVRSYKFHAADSDIVDRKRLHFAIGWTRGIFHCLLRYVLFDDRWNKTTAHTLAFAFGLLALHPDEQEILFQHIKEILADGRPPVGRLALELFTLLMVHARRHMMTCHGLRTRWRMFLLHYLSNVTNPNLYC